MPRLQGEEGMQPVGPAPRAAPAALPGAGEPPGACRAAALPGRAAAARCINDLAQKTPRVRLNSKESSRELQSSRNKSGWK